MQEKGKESHFPNQFHSLQQNNYQKEFVTLPACESHNTLNYIQYQNCGIKTIRIALEVPALQIKKIADFYVSLVHN